MSDLKPTELLLLWRAQWCQELMSLMLVDVTDPGYLGKGEKAYQWIRFYEDLISSRVTLMMQHANRRKSGVDERAG